MRKYTGDPIPESVLTALREKIDEVNRIGNLHVQLVTDEPKSFSGLMAYGAFSGVNSYLVMAGKKDDSLDERIGYYGEQLVLLAQTLGLNSCWAGASYKRIPGTYVLEDDEKIGCYIAIGFGINQGKKGDGKLPVGLTYFSSWYNSGSNSSSAVTPCRWLIDIHGSQVRCAPIPRMGFIRQCSCCHPGPAIS